MGCGWERENPTTQSCQVTQPLWLGSGLLLRWQVCRNHLRIPELQIFGCEQISCYQSFILLSNTGIFWLVSQGMGVSVCTWLVTFIGTLLLTVLLKMPQPEVCGLACNKPLTEVTHTHTVTGQKQEVSPFLVGSGFQREHCLFSIVIIFYFPALVGITSDLTHEVGFEEYDVLKNM